MSDVVDALDEQHAELGGFLDGLSDADWQRPSSCDGWTVSDVVLHLAQTNEMAVGSASGRFREVLASLADRLTPLGSVDDGADAMVARDRGASSEEVYRRWRRSADDLGDALRSCDPHARVTWVVGQLSARTLATTRLAETWIHTGDITTPFGVPPTAAHRLSHVVRLAWRTLPHAFAREGRTMTGPVAFDLVGPSGESWAFGVDDAPLTTITGPALDLLAVASRRVPAADTALHGSGPDASAVLELVRTWA